MPDNLETRFSQEVRKLKQKKRKLMLWRVGLLLLLVMIVSGLVFLWYQSNYVLKIGNSNINLNAIVFSVIGLIIVTFIVIFNIKNRTSFYFGDWRLNYLKNIKIKYLLGWSTLLIVLIYQSNPSLLDAPISSLMTYVIHRPTPPVLKSPWPWQENAKIHPIIANMPSHIETSIQSVAKYIAQQESDPYLRIKAIHDYVISRVSYDLDVLKTGIRPSQDAQTVFFSHKAVCEGYANLFMALGRNMGADVVYISGKIRRDLAPVDLIPNVFRLLESNYDWTNHAWNAVKVSGNWQLVDTTWDDTESNEFSSAYSSEYLMLPPQVMSISHFPKQSSWQLLPSSEDYNNFEKKPVLTPQFFIDKLQLISPNEYQTNVKEVAVIKIATSPNYQKKIVGIFEKIQKSEPSLWELPGSGNFLEGNQDKQREKPDMKLCQSQTNANGETEISCNFSEPGDYQVVVLSLESQAKLSFLGQLKFHALLH